jgi:putative transposase
MMNPDGQNPEVGRKNPSMGVHFELGRPTIVLLTVSTEKREPWLADSEVHRLLCETWTTATAWQVGDYLLMPDHLHLFCAPRDFSFTIEQWITFWKRDFRRRHQHPEWKFQSRGWHHRLRAEEDYSTKWLYVQENPIRKKLVDNFEAWPFKGNIHQLLW